MKFIAFHDEVREGLAPSSHPVTGDSNAMVRVVNIIVEKLNVAYVATLAIVKKQAPMAVVDGIVLHCHI